MTKYNNTPGKRLFNETKVYGLVQLLGITIVVVSFVLGFAAVMAR